MMNNHTVTLPWPSDDAHTPEAVRAEVIEWLGEVLPEVIEVIVTGNRAPDTGYPLVTLVGFEMDLRQLLEDHADRFGDESVTY